MNQTSNDSSTELRILLLMPAYEDGEPAEVVIRRVAKLLPPGMSLGVIVIDDGSVSPIDFPALRSASLAEVGLREITILRLKCNVGHQRAIAIGLVHALRTGGYDFLVVMDSDGEDRPEDVFKMVERALVGPEVGLVVAERGSRSEGFAFRTGYAGYRVIFRLLTGASLPFGNFSVVPQAVVERLTSMPELWNHYAATLRRSGLPIDAVVLDRGNRVAGRSKMRLTSLVTHGLSAIAAFADSVFARLLAAFVLLSILLLTIIGTLILVRSTTTLAMPGWTTIVVGLAGLGLLQVGSVVASLTFVMLNGRSTSTVGPAAFADDFVASSSRIT